MQRQLTFGGGVSRRFTHRLKGQSTVEYVLIIAIIVLVVLIAGPWVSSAIRNQFNLVAGTLGNGINKGSWETGGTGGGNGSLTDADIGAAVGVRGVAQHRLLDDGTDPALVAGCARCGKDAGGIDLGHGMSDNAIETLSDVPFGEAVVALGHALPFSPLRQRIAIFGSCGRLRYVGFDRGVGEVNVGRGLYG